MHNGQLSRTGPKILMVTKKSATNIGVTGVSDDDIIPIDADHSKLVKFESRGQDAYIIVRERIKGFISSVTSSRKNGRLPHIL